jgi:hypothetical protein
MVENYRRGRSDASLLGYSRLSSRHEPTRPRDREERHLLMKKHLPTTLEAIGTSIVAVSLSFVSIPLGLGFAGLAMIAFGIAAERSQ